MSATSVLAARSSFGWLLVSEFSTSTATVVATDLAFRAFVFADRRPPGLFLTFSVWTELKCI